MAQVFSSPKFLGNAGLFTKCLFTIFVPLDTRSPNQQSDGLPLDFLLKGPQTELRTLSQNCEQTLQKLRTNRIMNKRAFPNSGAGNGCANFMCACHFWLFLLEKPHAHKIPRYRGGGGCWGFLEGGGWKCQFYFYERGDFSELRRRSVKHSPVHGEK